MSTPGSGARARQVAVAAGLAALVTAVEYLFRHYVLFWIPRIGSLRVNDMIVLAVAYVGLVGLVGSVVHLDWRQARGELRAGLVELASRWERTRWAVALFLGIVVLAAVDHLLWGEARLPMLVSRWRNPVVLFAAAAPVLVPVVTIAVNGFVVPVAEEFLWRGQVQQRLAAAIPAAAAIAITAVLFSLKHVLVDASWGRFLTLVAFGAICGLVARRHGWPASAALHGFVNATATVVGLVRGN